MHNLGESYFYRPDGIHEVKVILTEERKKEILNFIEKV
jgi:hypothetical protein